MMRLHGEDQGAKMQQHMEQRLTSTSASVANLQGSAEQETPDL